MENKKRLIINLEINNFSKEIMELFYKRNFKIADENRLTKSVELQNKEYKQTQNPLFFYNLYHGDSTANCCLSTRENAKDLKSNEYIANMVQVGDDTFKIKYLTSKENDSWPIKDIDELKFLTYELENHLSYIIGIQGTIFLKNFYTSHISRNY